MSDESTAVELNQSEDQYTDWYGFDTENDERGVVTLAALVHESGSRTVWKKGGEFAKLCESGKLGKKPVVICHNLEYDLVNEFGVDAYAMFSLNYLKGRLISARYKNIRFLDSFNHFRMRLADIGTAIGVKKLDMDIYSEEYVSQDAWICLKVMVDARDYIAGLGGRIGATSGSSAMSVWRYMTEDEYLTGPIDTAWLRKGYYGGRTEIFRPHTECPLIRDAQGRIKYERTSREAQFDPASGLWWAGDERELRKLEQKGEVNIEREKNIRGYDINSMYPYCMKFEFPEYLMDDPTFIRSKGMAEVTIQIPLDLPIGPLPYRTGNDELWYPVGVVRGVWTYDEIRMAESMGSKILKVHKASGCNTLVRPFNQFIDTLYAKRKQSKIESERLFLKVLMNALYGKIASKNQVTRTVSRYNLMKTGSKRMEEVKWINYHRGLLDYFTPQQAYVNVCWGSMITAYARLLLLKYMKAVPSEKLIYCDTDSMYCLDYTLPESKELGGMKLEHSAGIMVAVQPKAYRIDDFYKAKGVPKAKKDEHGNIIVDFARQYIEDGFTEFQAPIRFRASINSKRGKANQWVTHSKGRKTAYRAKRLSGDRYVPPIVGEQLQLELKAASKGKHKGQTELKLV
jgi:hypothetical protein